MPVLRSATIMMVIIIIIIIIIIIVLTIGSYERPSSHSKVGLPGTPRDFLL
jgi:hypothetical protein